MCLVQDNVYVYRFVNKGVDKHSIGRTFLRMPANNKVFNAMVLASRWYVHKKAHSGTLHSPQRCSEFICLHCTYDVIINFDITNSILIECIVTLKLNYNIYLVVYQPIFTLSSVFACDNTTYRFCTIKPIIQMTPT